MTERFTACWSEQHHIVTCARCGQEHIIRLGSPWWKVMLNGAGLFGWTIWHQWRDRKKPMATPPLLSAHRVVFQPDGCVYEVQEGETVHRVELQDFNGWQCQTCQKQTCGHANAAAKQWFSEQKWEEEV